MPTHPDEPLSIEALARVVLEARVAAIREPDKKPEAGSHPPISGFALDKVSVRAVLAALFSPASGLGLVEALEPFADIGAQEGSEDFPDTTPCDLRFGRTTDYSLTLADLRSAAKALATIRRMME